MAFIAQDDMMGTVDLSIIDPAGPGPFALVGGNAGKMGRASYYSQFMEAIDTMLGGGFFCYAQAATIAPQTVSSVTISGSTATVTTGSAHGLGVGAVVNLTGFTPSTYNGLWRVNAISSATVFTIDMSVIINQSTVLLNPSAAGSAATNGNVPAGNGTVMGTYTVGLGAGQIVQFTHSTDSNGNLVLTATPWTGTANSGLSLGVCYTNPYGGQWAWFQIGGAMPCYTAGSPAVGNQTYWSALGVVQPSAVASKQCQGTQYASAAAATFGSGSAAQTLKANQAVIWGTFPLAQGAIT